MYERLHCLIASTSFALALVVGAAMWSGNAAFGQEKKPGVYDHSDIHDTIQVLDEPLFSFAHVSDPHIYTGDGAERLSKAMSLINVLKPDFLLLTGDMTGGDAVYLKLLQEILGELEVPFYAVPGNTDKWTPGDGYRQFMGPEQYSFRHKGVHFVALSGAKRGVHGGRLDAEEIQQFEADLEKGRDADQVFVFCHFDWDAMAGWKDLVLPRLIEHRVTAYLHGHSHKLRLNRFGGVSVVGTDSSRSVRMYYVYPERTVVVTPDPDGKVSPRYFASLRNPRRRESVAPAEENVRFTVFANTRTEHQIYRQIVNLAAAERADFHVSLGDQVANGDRKLWTNFFDVSRPLMESTPFYLVPGNHDLAGEDAEDVYREMVEMPGNELYYSFDSGPLHGIVLNTEGGDLKTTQLEWLRRDLESCDAPRRMVFLHRPMYPAITHLTDSLNADALFRNRLHLLLIRHGVDAVFAGQVHAYKREVVGDLLHIMTGGGGAPVHGSAAKGGFHHIVVVDVKGEKTSASVKVLNPYEVFTVQRQ